jgi:SOS-response transcriptional repressor LexA
MTEREAELYKYLLKKKKEEMVTPSYQEMADDLGYSSKSQVARVLDNLERDGFVKRSLYKRHRSLTILEEPDDYKKGYRDGYNAGSGRRASHTMR